MLRCFGVFLIRFAIVFSLPIVAIDFIYLTLLPFDFTMRVWAVTAAMLVSLADFDPPKDEEDR